MPAIRFADFLLTMPFQRNEEEEEKNFVQSEYYQKKIIIPQPKSSNNQYEDQLFNAGQFTKKFKKKISVYYTQTRAKNKKKVCSMFHALPHSVLFNSEVSLYC